MSDINLNPKKLSFRLSSSNQKIVQKNFPTTNKNINKHNYKIHNKHNITHINTNTNSQNQNNDTNTTLPITPIQSQQLQEIHNQMLSDVSLATDKKK